VLLLHGEIEGVFPEDRSAAEYGGALVNLAELGADEWTYVALGHYHVQHQVATRAWYAGALEYVSPNIWGELGLEADEGVRGKGWLLADLDDGSVQRMPLPPGRRILDLEPVRAEGRSAAWVSDQIAARLRAVAGGIAEKIVRLRVYDIPRHVARELDHAAIRGFKNEALHFHLDLRRPDVQRAVGVGAPGKRQTLPELVTSYLSRRPLPAELDREAFVRLGQELMDSVERDVVGG
jgi:hypothetical protein